MFDGRFFKIRLGWPVFMAMLVSRSVNSYLCTNFSQSHQPSIFLTTPQTTGQNTRHEFLCIEKLQGTEEASEASADMFLKPITMTFWLQLMRSKACLGTTKKHGRAEVVDSLSLTLHIIYIYVCIYIYICIYIHVYTHLANGP